MSSLLEKTNQKPSLIYLGQMLLWGASVASVSSGILKDKTLTLLLVGRMNNSCIVLLCLLTLAVF